MPADTVDLSEFPVVIDLPVLWGDMDAFQHVNNEETGRHRERYCYGLRLSHPAARKLSTVALGACSRHGEPPSAQPSMSSLGQPGSIGISRETAQIFSLW